MHEKAEIKKLYKSNTNRVFSGVVGGVGEYFKIDPVLLRVIWLLVVVFTGFVPGIIAYIISTIIVPRKRAH
ncbi:MAG: PspC domain-containing protein [bacterium]|nr:PspC domain-containing protein [bacterium]